PGDTSDKTSSKQRVEELYRLADMIHASSKIIEAEEQQRRVWAEKRLQDLIEANGYRPAAAPDIKRHRWVVDVLADLADYARSVQLTLLEDCLHHAQLLSDVLLRQ
ncbi:unnamed protein product, partial [Ectocarpus fasciculatus]